MKTSVLGGNIPGFGSDALDYKMHPAPRKSQLPPDFLLDIVTLIHSMRLSSRKGAHAAFSGAAWQEIRVARRFRPMYAGANMGHPSDRGWLERRLFSGVPMGVELR